MSSPDPFQGRVWVFPALESQDPVVTCPDPTRKGSGSVSEVRPSCTGSGAFHAVGPDPLRVSGTRPFPWPRGDPKAAGVARQRAVRRATRDFSAQRLYLVARGTPISRYRQCPQAHLKGGCKPAGGAKTYILHKHSMTGDRGIFLARTVLTQHLHAVSLLLVTPTVVPVFAADWRVAPTHGGLAGPRVRGAPCWPR
jgi:hypothetical protein